jgi:hypothetical protein
MTRRVLLILAMASLGAGVGRAQAPTPPDQAARLPPKMPACQASLQRTGSNAAKASTPVGAGQSGGQSAGLAPRHDTVWSTTAKGSTPIRAATDVDRPRTAGTLTPKGSVPVGGAADLRAGSRACAP